MIWAKEETMSRAEIEAVQLNRLKDTVRGSMSRVPAYRAKMDEAGVKPEAYTDPEGPAEASFYNEAGYEG